MDHLVLDTHTLIWFLQGEKRIPAKAREAILDGASHKCIPFISLCEVAHIHARGRLLISPHEIIRKTGQMDNFEIIFHDTEHLEHMSPNLDIHDALIVASAIVLKKRINEPVSIISKDELIQQFSPVPVVWEK